MVLSASAQYKTNSTSSFVCQLISHELQSIKGPEHKSVPTSEEPKLTEELTAI